MAENIVEITESNFETEVLQSDVPVLVDFWAPWCGPCKMMMPVLEGVAANISGTVKVAKVNTDENNPLAVRFKIEGLPTLVMFNGGEEVKRHVGMANEQQLNDIVAV